MIKTLISNVIRREGGYVNHSADRGGPTKYGITLATLEAWRRKRCTAEDVRDMEEPEAYAIYMEMYWIQPGFRALGLPVQLNDMLLDASVHHGPNRATRLLQSAAEVKADGVLGPLTREAIAEMDPALLAARFVAERVSFLGRIITNNQSQAVFAAGWLNRMGEFIRQIPQL